jgi:parallel beta-helix repeat protein
MNLYVDGHYIVLSCWPFERGWTVKRTGEVFDPYAERAISRTVDQSAGILDRGIGRVRDSGSAHTSEQVKKIGAVVGLSVMAAFLLSAAFIETLSLPSSTPQEPPVPSRVLDLAPHDPIYIGSNAGFINDSGVVWGSGTDSDPYVISGWDINASSTTGILIAGTNAHFIIRDCYVHGGHASFLSSTHGIELLNCVNGVVEHNNCSDGCVGIYLELSRFNMLTDNTCDSNTLHGLLGAYGIELSSSDHNFLANNTCRMNGFGGIYLESSEYDTLVSNTMNNDGLSIGGSYVSEWTTHDIDTSNTVNGKPLYYCRNQSGVTVPDDTGEVILANCTDFLVEGQILNGSSAGIILGFCTNGTVRNNICDSNCIEGIHLCSSDDNTMVNNTCRMNSQGIQLYSSKRNTLTRNDCTFNSDGILLTSSYDNNLVSNNCSLNVNGIRLLNDNNNTLSDNNCSSNVNFGIYSYSSRDDALINNFCTSNGYEGVELSSSEHNTLTSNDCSFNNNDGIELWDSSNNTLVSNNCSSNSDYGILLDSTNMDNEIHDNLICYNVGYGVYITVSYSSSNRLWNNTFAGNNGAGSTYDPNRVQANDDGTDNWWNSSDGIGNFWSDWTTPDTSPPDGIVDLPYDISGSAGAKDYYPLTTAPPQLIPEFGSLPLVIVVFLAAVFLAKVARK